MGVPQGRDPWHSFRIRMSQKQASLLSVRSRNCKTFRKKYILLPQEWAHDDIRLILILGDKGVSSPHGDRKLALFKGSASDRCSSRTSSTSGFPSAAPAPPLFSAHYPAPCPSGQGVGWGWGVLCSGLRQDFPQTLHPHHHRGVERPCILPSSSHPKGGTTHISYSLDL